MKKFFLFSVISFLFFAFGNCGTIPITDDICQITTEICHYADAICSVYGSAKLSADTPEEIKSQLVNAKNDLMSFQKNLYSLKRSLTPENEQTFKLELSKIRDELKEIYEQKCRKVE